MKKRFLKIVSMVLVFASLFSLSSVFAVASEGDVKNNQTNSTDYDSLEIMYNRNFQEGWDYDNAFGTLSNSKVPTHKAYIDYEETSDHKYNYFWRIESTDEAKTAFSTFEFGTSVARDNGTIVEFKIKADDACDLGRILYMTTAASKAIDILFINGTALYAFQPGAKPYKICDLSNEWMTLTFCFDWDATTTISGKTDTYFKCRVYYGDEGAYLDYGANYAESGDKGMKTLNFGIGTGDGKREGMSYCIDDLRIYQKTKVPVDFSGYNGYGFKVDNLADKVVDIQEGPGKMSIEEVISSALCMKVGVDSALIGNKKQSIEQYCTPVAVQDENGEKRVMIPLELVLDFIGYPYYLHTDGLSYDITTGTSSTYIAIGRDSVTVDGERIPLTAAPGYLKNGSGKDVPVIAVEDVAKIFPGWLTAYDDMGLIVVYQAAGAEDGELISRDKNLDLMLTIMKRFVFDTVTVDENGKAFEEASESYVATGKKVISDVKKNTNDFTHPYIFTNQDNFDALKTLYTSTNAADAVAKGHLATLIAKADKIYSYYANLNPTDNSYIGIIATKKPVNVYGDQQNPNPENPADTTVKDTSDGYNPSGTLEVIETYTEELVNLAFAYQVTRNEKYALLAYDISLALGEWTHWGPGYVLNCATATGNFAVSYDWLYNFYFEKFGQEGVDRLADIIYEKGVSQGYNVSSGGLCAYPKTAGGDDVYATLKNNWNASCSSSMIIGALAISSYGKYEDVNSYLIGNNMQNLIENGLDMYAPDGSYAESALMWAEGTNGLTKLIMAFSSAAGTAYGFDDTWGIDKTFYYACYIEDSDGKIWNYHEGGADGFITGEILGIDTQMFFYAGKFLGDSTLVAIRENQLAKGKEVTIFDMLFYPTDKSSLDVELQLDYYMEGVQAFVSRSDWNEGALYTGIMGGANDVYGGQIDSGNFIYRNKGVTWFMDLGSDNQDLYSYFGSYRYRHYRNNAEGQNLVAIITEAAQAKYPYGQDVSGNGQIIKTLVNEHGSLAVLDNSSAYGSLVSYANRGMLVTNDRKTVVIQDEISFSKAQEVIWIAHTAAKVTIDSKNKKVAYLTTIAPDGKGYTLRATIVSKVAYEWETMSADAGILDSTFAVGDSEGLGGGKESSRKDITRLVINSGKVPVFNVAVVLEILDENNVEKSAEYVWSDMMKWVPTAAGTLEESAQKVRSTPQKADIKEKTSLLAVFYDIQGNAFTESIAACYDAITLIAYTLKTYEPQDLESYLLEYYGKYVDYRAIYEDFTDNINGSVSLVRSFSKKMSGIASSD